MSDALAFSPPCCCGGTSGCPSPVFAVDDRPATMRLQLTGCSPKMLPNLDEPPYDPHDEGSLTIFQLTGTDCCDVVNDALWDLPSSGFDSPFFACSFERIAHLSLDCITRTWYSPSPHDHWAIAEDAVTFLNVTAQMNVTSDGKVHLTRATMNRSPSGTRNAGFVGDLILGDAPLPSNFTVTVPMNVGDDETCCDATMGDLILTFAP